MTEINWWIVILGVLITGLSTSIGAAFVYFIKKKHLARLNTVFLGFAAGVMIAASVWSLIIPAFDYANEQFWGQVWGFVPVVLGFGLGAFFMWIIDKLVPHKHAVTGEVEGLETKKERRSWKLFAAMIIHNVPEGLSVGIVFGAAIAAIRMPGSVENPVTLFGALALAIGMGIQNIPEGAAVSIPMAETLGSKRKAFGMGVLSGVVEPVAAVIGIVLGNYLGGTMPWLLSFAAGTMMYVVIEELIPATMEEGNTHVGTFSVLFGFAVMMVLDVLLG